MTFACVGWRIFADFDYRRDNPPQITGPWHGNCDNGWMGIDSWFIYFNHVE